MLQLAVLWLCSWNCSVCLSSADYLQLGHEQSRPPPIDTVVGLATPNGGISLTSMCTCNNHHDNVRANAVHSYNCEGDRAGLVCSLRVCACTHARLLSDSTCVSLLNSI